MRKYYRQAVAALLLCAGFIFCLTCAPDAAVSKDEYLSKGTAVYGQSDSGRRDTSPLEDLNWLRSKAATEEMQRRALENELRGVRGELESVKAEKLDLENKVYDLEDKVTELESRPATVVATGTECAGHAAYAIAQGYYEVVEGDSLWKIAGREEVFGDCFKWSELFYANKDKITNPNVIYPGQVLQIPEYYVVPELTVTEVAKTEAK